MNRTEALNLTEKKEMEYIQVTKENIEKEHICCAISNNKGYGSFFQKGLDDEMLR